jgi:hypothetical protein
LQIDAIDRLHEIERPKPALVTPRCFAAIFLNASSPEALFLTVLKPQCDPRRSRLLARYWRLSGGRRREAIFFPLLDIRVLVGQRKSGPEGRFSANMKALTAAAPD